MRTRRGLLVVAFALCVSLWTALAVGAAARHGQAPPAVGESESDWLAPVNISRTPGRSNMARLATDSMGRVHVVWTEDTQTAPGATDRDAIHQGDAIFYTQWDGSGWSEPVDVQIPSQRDGLVHLPAIAVDRENGLHLVWADQGLGIAYSRCPAGLDPRSARSWTTPISLSWAESDAFNLYWPDIKIGPDGTIHVAWSASSVLLTARNRWGEVPARVFYVRSTDGGRTWSGVVRAADALAGVAPSESSGMPRIALFGEVVGLYWVQSGDEVPTPGAKTGHAVWMAESADGGASWSEPLELVDVQVLDPAWLLDTPGALVYGLDGEPRLFFGGGPHLLEWRRTRALAVRDTGVTLDEGIERWLDAAVDALGTVHLVWMSGTQAEGRPPLQVEYGAVQGDTWVARRTISNQVEGSVSAHFYSALRPKIAVGLGNQLHVVWHQWDEGTRSWDIFYTRGGPEQPLYTPAPPPATPSPEAGEQARFDGTPVAAVMTPVASPTTARVLPETAGPVTSRPPTNQIMAGILIGDAILVLALGGLALRWRRRH